ncbi:unnamed protein product [Amoebophrya sp. A25]|nr:unnamed protein product [Amoebophrya sp. A25]|eukprot:GSA25T00017134001.1
MTQHLMTGRVGGPAARRAATRAWSGSQPGLSQRVLVTQRRPFNSFASSLRDTVSDFIDSTRSPSSSSSSSLPTSSLSSSVSSTSGAQNAIFPEQHPDDRVGSARLSGRSDSKDAFRSNFYLGVEGLRRPSDFPRLARAAIADADRQIRSIKGEQLRPPTPTPRQLLRSLDAVSASLCNIADAAELTRNVHPNTKWGDSANEAVNEIAGFMSVVNLDEEIFAVMRESAGRWLASSSNRSDLESSSPGTKDDKVVSSGDRELLARGWRRIRRHASSATTAVLNEDSLKESSFADLSSIEPDLNVEETAVFGHMLESMANEGVGMPDADKRECLELQGKEQELAFQLAGAAAGEIQVVQGQGGDKSKEKSSVVEDHWDQVTSGDMKKAEPMLSPLLPYLEQRRGGGIFSKSPPEVNLAGEQMAANPHLAEAMLRYCPIEAARRKTFAIQHREIPGVEEQLVELLNARTRLAQLRGYDTWNIYAQRDSILGGPGNVNRFLRAAWEALKPGLQEELKVLGSNLEGDVIHPWDVAFLTEQHKRSLGSSLDSIGAHLSLEALMNGVNIVLEHQLNLRFTERRCDPKLEVWHPTVRKWTLESKNGAELLGVLYVDALPRQNKRVQSAQFTLQGSRIVEHEGHHHFAGASTGDSGIFKEKKMPRALPCTALVCSIPEGNIPPSAALTFMHEVGHCVHSLLSQTEFQSLSGTRGAVDFVEFPSHLFEYYVMDPDMLEKMLAIPPSPSGHGGGQVGHLRDTGSSTSSMSSLQRAALQDFRKHRHLFSHIEACQQLLFAAVDQEFYNCPLGVDVKEMRDRVFSQIGDNFPDLKKMVNAKDGSFVHFASNAPKNSASGTSTSPNPSASGATNSTSSSSPSSSTSTLHQILSPLPLSRFEHLIHYGGSYYCYLLNKVLACHTWRHGGFAPGPGVGRVADVKNTTSGASSPGGPGDRLLQFMHRGSVAAHMNSILALVPPLEKRAAISWQESCSGRLNWDIDLDAYVEELRRK